MSRLAAVGCALLAAVAWAGCGEREEKLSADDPARVEVAAGEPDPGQAPVYAAQTRGRFREAGLEVRMRSAGDPLEELAAGRADLALASEPELLAARDGGRAVVSVAAVVPRPLEALVWLPSSGIREPAGLRDRRVGTAGAGHQTAFLRTIVESAGAGAAREVRVGDGLARALLRRRVDAALGLHLNALDPGLARRRPTVLPVDRAGVPPYGEVLVVAREDALESEGGEIRSFVGAVARGAGDLRSERARGEAVAALVAADRAVPATVHRAGIARTLPLLAPPRGRPFGWQEPRRRRAFARYLREAEVVERRDGEAFTNDLLPGQGLP